MSYQIQTNFTAGELSPRLIARVDFEKYQNGCAFLENFLIHPHGGATRRPGFRFVAGVKDSSKQVRLQEFEFSTTQTYILEFGNLYMRVYKDQGQVIVALADATAWLTGTSYTAGNFRKNGGKVYYCIHGHTSGATTEPGVGADWDDEWAEQEVYEIPTTYTEAELDGLGFCQSADTMYIVHKNHAPAKLERTGHTAWTLANISFTSAPSVWTTANYPQIVMFYEQRLCFAGTPNEPQTIWMSKSGSYYDFGVSSPLVDADACTFTLVSNQVNAIRWMLPGKRLLIGTSGAEWEMGGSGSEAITPFNVTAQRHTTYGSKDYRPAQVGNIILYIQRNGRKLREFAYSYEADGYISGDMTLLAEHLTNVSQLGQVTYQQDPDPIIWVIRDDGQLCALSYMREQKVYAWHRHPMINGVVESAACIPGDGYEELWVVVKRTINGTVKRYVEILDPLFFGSSAVDAFFVDSGLTYDGRNTADTTLALSAGSTWVKGTSATLTASLSAFTNPGSVGQVYALQDPASETDSFDPSAAHYRVEVTGYTSGTEVTVKLLDTIPAVLQGHTTTLWAHLADDISNLGHLEGQSVQVLADGAVVADKTVTFGAIHIPRPAAVVHVGIGYTSVLQTMNMEIQTQQGTAQGRVKRIGKVVARVYKSLGGKLGRDATNVDELVYRTSADAMGLPVPLFTGDKEIAYPYGYDSEAFVYAIQDQPLPFALLAVITSVDVTEV